MMESIFTGADIIVMILICSLFTIGHTEPMQTRFQYVVSTILWVFLIIWMR